MKNSNASNKVHALQKTPGFSGVVVECEKISLNFLNSCISGCSLSCAIAVNFQPLQFAIPANLAYFWSFVASCRTLGEQAAVVILCTDEETWLRLQKNGLTKA